MSSGPCTAAILDMDGVITRTAKLHAEAWKRMFDEYLQRRGQEAGTKLAPFDIGSDYRRYVDGKPRYDGVRSFLASRQITLPEGEPQDDARKETICGLGNRKNELFQEVLRQKQVEVWEDTIEQIQRWKTRGWKLAVISSSRNCTKILESASVLDLFDAKVDGADLSRLQMPGKPAPDMFLHAAQLLGVEPSRAIVVEDAIAGVAAGRSGNFRLVVGVLRNGDPGELRDAGADVVVRDVRELDSLLK